MVDHEIAAPGGAVGEEHDLGAIEAGFGRAGGDGGVEGEVSAHDVVAELIGLDLAESEGDAEGRGGAGADHVAAERAASVIGVCGLFGGEARDRALHLDEVDVAEVVEIEAGGEVADERGGLLDLGRRPISSG